MIDDLQVKIEETDAEITVERHGGEIRVDSEPGEGTTFAFTLPKARDGDE